MSRPPKPIKLHCKNCGYKAVYNPNTDFLVTQPPRNRRYPHCLSWCEIGDVKAIFVGGTWIVIEKTPYEQLG